MGYKKDVIKGVSFMGFLRIAIKAVGFLEAIILARILLPSEFGAYFVALIALGVIEVFTETGINIILIQERSINKFINSAWIISIGRGLLIGLFLFFAAPYVAVFFHSEESLFLIRLICMVPILRGFINPAIILLQKNLEFRKDAFYRLTILLFDTFVSVTITYMTKSPAGIVVGLLVGTAIEMFLSFFIVSARPRLSFKRKQIAEVFHRGKWVTAAGFFDYLYENLDNIVVGKMLGTGALGIYELGYALAVIPLNETGKVFVHVTTPIFLRFSGDTSRLKKAFLKTLLSVFLIISPIILIFIFFPSIFVFLLGEKWAQVSLVLPLLAILGLFRSLSGVSSALFLSRKKQKYITLSTLVMVSGLVATIFPLVNNFGIFGAVVAGIIGSVLAVPLIVYLAFRTL